MTTRERMVAGAARLLSHAGMAEASFRNVVASTGTPRGSISHHFPGGKEEMISASIGWVGDRLLEVLRRSDVARPEDVVGLFAGMFRRLLVESDAQAGCAVAAVAASAARGTPSAQAAAAAFSSWEVELAALFTQTGLPRDRSTALAVTTLAVVEGAVLLARARGDLTPFDTAVEQLLLLAQAP